MAGHRVGGDVDAYCTKCRMILGHTIIAMVADKIAKVRCNTCQGLHAYKAGPPGTRTASSRAPAEGRTRPAAARPAREKVETRPFEELFAGRDTSDAKPYSPRERFVEGEILAHPTFGLGLVKNARQDKVEVIFKLGEKTLVHALPGGPKAPVSFAKPGRREEGAASTSGSAADKPPPGQPTGLHVVHNEPLTEMPQRDVDAADADGAALEETVRE
ncbi:hypothetical protein [Vulgatibacter sp.]|uniref:hypothetical protein n=1 Tax=Vulgatibacter sp. TaxID=1971226 RepID=UPI00356B33A3